MTEIVKASDGGLRAQMDYAQAVSRGAMLPQAYRGKPADILLAVGLGQAMGLSPAESLYRIDVIQGKPTASAELIAANVRKAGHKLRVTGDETTCTAQIIRADDPEFEFKVTRDLKWAQGMGLHTKDNYKKQPGTMLQWRAISAVARLACPEALYGVAYTPDELGDLGERPSPAPSAVDLLDANGNDGLPGEIVDSPQSGRDWATEIGNAAGDTETLTALWHEATTTNAPQEVIAQIVAAGNAAKEATT